MSIKGGLPDWYASQEKNARDDKENLWRRRPQVPDGNKGWATNGQKEAPLKTVESSILYFTAQLEDDKTNAAQKCGNLRRRLENIVLGRRLQL